MNMLPASDDTEYLPAMEYQMVLLLQEMLVMDKWRHAREFPADAHARYRNRVVDIAATHGGGAIIYNMLQRSGITFGRELFVGPVHFILAVALCRLQRLQRRLRAAVVAVLRAALSETAFEFLKNMKRRVPRGMPK